MINPLNQIRSNGTAPKQLPVGVCTGPNTFGTRVLEHVEQLQPAFAMDIPVHGHSDTDLGGDPIAGAQLAKMAKNEWQTHAGHGLADARAGVVSVESIGGSGFLAHSLANCPEKVIRPVVNIIVGSHRLTATNGGPQPVEAVTAALSYSQINRGTILLSNRAVEEGYGAIPRQVAELVATIVHYDLADLETGYFTGWHETIPINGMDQFNVGSLLAQARQNGKCWFDPDEFIWWDPPKDVQPFDPETSSIQSFALLPPEYDRASVQSVHATLQTEFIEGLDAGHLVVLKTINEEWIDELRRGHEWLRAQIEQDRNRYASRWAGLVEKHGLGENTEQALDRYCETHLE